MNSALHLDDRLLERDGSNELDPPLLGEESILLIKIILRLCGTGPAYQLCRHRLRDHYQQ